MVRLVKKSDRVWWLLILCFFLLNIFTWVTWAEFKFGIPQVIKYLLSVTVLIILFLYSFTHTSRIIRDDIFFPIFLWFYLYSIFLLIDAFLDFNALIYVQRTFADRTFLIPYLLPLIVLIIRFDIHFFIALIKFALPLMLLVIVIQLYIFIFDLSPDNWLEHFERINIFNLASGFLILNSHYFRKKYNSIILVLHYLLFIILALVYGRRGGAISGMLLLIFMIYFRLQSPFFDIKKRVRIYLAGIFLVVIFLSFGYLLQSTYAFERGFSKEAFEESRGAVFTDFFEDFNSAEEWILGRGIMGRVYRSIYSEGSLDIVEQGFLTVILRGGILYLAPFVLIFLRAVYLGFFKSNNELVKGLSILVFLHVALMFYFNLPDFSTYYIFIWISVTACYDPMLRRLNNVEVFKAISSI